MRRLSESGDAVRCDMAAVCDMGTDGQSDGERADRARVWLGCGRRCVDDTMARMAVMHGTRTTTWLQAMGLYAGGMWPGAA